MKVKSVYTENLNTAAITDAATVVYTVPNNTRTKFLLALISNNTGATIAGASIEVFDSNGAYLIENAKSLAAGERSEINFGDKFIMLEAGQQIRARADDTGVSSILTVEETTGLVSTN